MSFTLFEISDEIHELAADLELATAEGNAVLAASITESILESLDNLGNKYEGYVHVVKSSEALAKAAKETAKEFQSKANTHTNLAKRLKTRLLEDMTQHGTQKAPAGAFQLAIQKNSAPTIEVENPEELPEEYQVHTVAADKHELRRAIKRGEEIPGVNAEIGSHLRIRVR